MHSVLTALPYLQAYNPAPKQSGVTRYDPAKADNGLNFFYSGHEPSAYLTDMEGKVLHKWHLSADEIWPGDSISWEYKVHTTYWRRAKLLANGDVLALFEGIGLIKIDKNSRLVWANLCRAHHDMFVHPDGNIYTLTRHENSSYLKLGNELPVLEDFITILSPDGKELKRTSLLDCFLHSDYASILHDVKMQGDIFHTNTLEYLDGSVAGLVPFFQKGRLLVSFRQLSTIAVVDPGQEKITWALNGMFLYQHEPHALGNGHILLFDNQGEKGKSKVIEFNPLTQKVVWAFRNGPDNPFYSETCGTCQRLPNGNTLITESDAGRAIEVTPDNEIVWEFINPHTKIEDDKKLIATLLEVVRIPPGQVKCSTKSDCFK